MMSSNKSNTQVLPAPGPRSGRDPSIPDDNPKPGFNRQLLLTFLIYKDQEMTNFLNGKLTVIRPNVFKINEPNDEVKSACLYSLSQSIEAVLRECMDLTKQDNEMIRLMVTKYYSETMRFSFSPVNAPDKKFSFPAAVSVLH